MMLFRHVAIPTTIDVSEIDKLKSDVLRSLVVYENSPMDLVGQSECRDNVVSQFLEMRKKGLSVSLLFFVAPLFIDASKAKNTKREEAIAKLLEECSWVYSRKALVVLRDVVASPAGTSGSTDTIDTSYYVSLKATFKRFLESEGDPTVISRPMSILENAAALFGAAPSPLQRMTLGRVSPLSAEVSSKDSSLFETITRYLDLEVSPSTDADLQFKRGILESELEDKTIYSRRLLQIIGGRLIHLGVRLDDFLSSEYTSIRPKIVRAILNSQNMVALQTLLKVPTLSFDLEEDRSFRLEALLKISREEPLLGCCLVESVASEQKGMLLQAIFQSDVLEERSLHTRLKMTVLEYISSNQDLSVLLAPVRGEVVRFLAECINSPDSSLRHSLSKLQRSLLKTVLTDLCEALEVKENLEKFVAIILSDRGCVPAGCEREFQVLEAFSGPFRTMFQQKLTEFIMEVNQASVFMPSADNAEIYYEPSKIHAVFFYEANTRATVMERFSGVADFSEDTQFHLIPLCRMSGLSVDMGLVLPVVFLKEFMGISCDYKVLHNTMRDSQFDMSESGMKTFWSDLINKGYFSTRCKDIDSFEDKLTELIDLNNKYSSLHPLSARIQFSNPDKVVADLRQLLDLGYGVRAVVMATLDSLWVTNIPIRDICTLIKLYEANWNDGGVMVALRS